MTKPTMSNDEWEARDIEAEASALRSSKGGRCLAMLLALVGAALALPVYVYTQVAQ